MNIETFTDDEIITLDTVRAHPCISEGGECHIVSRHTIFDDGEDIEITDKVDVDVFATAAEAYKWAAVMSCKADDSRSVRKHTHNVSSHNIGRYPRPACSLSMQARRHCRNQRRKETPWQR